MAASLFYRDKRGQLKSITIQAGISILGRRPECDIRIPRSQVSRNHCRIVHRNEKILVQDLGSTNGTYVNKKRIIDKPVSIKAGDLLAVSNFCFIVQIDGQPEDIIRAAKEKISGGLVSEQIFGNNESQIGKTQISPAQLSPQNQ